MVKFRLYAHESKACEWLNEMARKGYRCTGFGTGIYNFAPCEPGAYNYHMDFVDFACCVPESYRDRAKQNGMRVAGVLGQWVILEAPAGVPFADLYHDSDACMQRTKHMLTVYKAVALIMALACIGLSWCAAEMPIQGVSLGACVATAIAAGIMFAVLGRRAFQVRDRLDEIRLEQGEAVATRNRVSLLLPAGCFLIGVAGMISEAQSAWICHFFRIVGCACVLIGLWRSVHRQRD